jgi:hypothetical protein
MFAPTTTIRMPPSCAKASGVSTISREATAARGTSSDPPRVTGSEPNATGSMRLLSGTRTTTSMRRGPSSIWVATADPSASSTWCPTSAELTPNRLMASRSRVTRNSFTSAAALTLTSAAPRMPAMIASARAAAATNRSGSSPKIRTPTSVVMPDSASSKRIWIGCVKA